MYFDYLRSSVDFDNKSKMESIGGRPRQFQADISVPESLFNVTPPKRSGSLPKLMNIPLELNNLDFGPLSLGPGTDHVDFVNPNQSQEDDLEKLKLEGNFKESPVKLTESHLEWKEMALTTGMKQLNRDVQEHKKNLTKAVTKIKKEAKEERDSFITALVQEVDDFKLPRAKVLFENKTLDEKIEELKKLCGECLNLDA